jgi:hypothetical protein
LTLVCPVSKRFSFGLFLKKKILLEIRAKWFLPGSEGVAGRNDPNTVCTYK